MPDEPPVPLTRAQREALLQPTFDWAGTADEVPEKIGDYEVDRVIARGAHGVVYKATDAHGIHVAIKWLKKRRDEHELETFVSLSKTVKGMPPILSSGILEDRTYFVMPYYERRSLRYRLSSLAFPQPLSEVVRLASAFTEVLGELHRNGYTHFDFKPDNLLLEALPSASDHSEFLLLRDDERLILTDFGTTRSADSEDQLGDGTPGYAAPELFVTIVDHDPRVDVYAASATLVECITGVLPDQVRTPSDSAFAPEVLSRTGSLEPVLRKGLSREPQHRQETISEWLDDLCEKADVVRSFSPNDSPKTSRIATHPITRPDTVPFTDVDRAVRGLHGEPSDTKASDVALPTHRTDALVTKAAKNVGAVVLSVVAAVALYWGLIQDGDRPVLADASSANGSVAPEPSNTSALQNVPDDSLDDDDSDSVEIDVAQRDMESDPIGPGPVEAGPALLDAQPDSDWGTLRRRLTAVQQSGDGPSQSDGARFHRIHESGRSVVSPNEQWILAMREFDWTIVDRSTGEYRFLDLGRDSQPTWHPSEPNTILHLAENDLALLSTEVGEGRTAVAADLRDRITSVLPDAAYFRAPKYGEPSQNGLRFAWAVFDVNEDLVGFATYDLSADVVLGIKGELPEGNIGDFHSTAIAKSGDTVVLAFAEVYVIYDVDFTNERYIEQRPQAYELALSATSEDVLVVANFDTGTFGTGWIVVHNLDDRQPTRLLNLYDNASTNIHFSGLAVDVPGWVLASTYKCRAPGAWSCDRIMALNIDDGSIINLAETNSCVRTDFAIPNAVVNRDFTRAWFNTNFGSCGEDASIVELEIGAFTK